MNRVQTKEIVRYLVPAYARGRTLDVGAGTAKYRKSIEPYVSIYETSDIEKKQGVDYVEDVTALSFEDNIFDTILCFQTLEHVNDADKAVSEIYRCLKKGGRCILTVPFLIPQHEVPFDYRRYTKRGLKELFEKHQFSVVEYGSYGGLFTVIEEFVKFLFLDPHAQKPHGFFRRKCVGVILKILCWMDRHGFSKTEKYYANVYIVAEK